MFYSKTMKTFFILIIIFLISILIFTFIVNSKNKKLKEQKNEIELLNKQLRENETQFNYLNKEMEIERRYNEKITKKLADISNMPIDDVLKQL